MIRWDELNPAVKQLCERISVEDGWPALRVEEKDRPRKLVSTLHKSALFMQVTSVVGLGDDEERSISVPVGTTGDDAPWAGAIKRTMVGHRRAHYRLTCDALQNTDRGWAWTTIERIRTRLRRRTSIDELRRVGAALNRIDAAGEANFRFEGRIVNRVFLDFALNVWICDVEQEPTGLLEYVVITSHVHDVDGVELPAPPNVVNLEIPTIPES